MGACASSEAEAGPTAPPSPSTKQQQAKGQQSQGEGSTQHTANGPNYSAVVGFGEQPSQPKPPPSAQSGWSQSQRDASVNGGTQAQGGGSVAEDPGSWIQPCGPSMPQSWRKGDSVGSGSFGNVYLGLNNDTGELLAIKEVSLTDDSGTAQRKEAMEQLEHEVLLLSTLDHPNIVRYVGTLREGTALLIFLEYVPGGSISSLLSRFGRLKESVICVYTRQLLSGLAYLHAQRTVHRDVKGANLLVETTGRVKLTDFGMAKQMVEDASFTKSFKGSAFWMAPEVIRQQGHGMAADIWSLGCTVLEMATGKPPWSQCTTQVQAIFKIASSQDLPAIPESLSPQATEFVLLCLQRDPAARPTAESLLNHPFVTFEDTSAVPALRTVDYRYQKRQQPPQQHHLPQQSPHLQHRPSQHLKMHVRKGSGSLEAARMTPPSFRGKTSQSSTKPEEASRSKSPAVTQDSLIEQVLGRAGRDPGLQKGLAAQPAQPSLPQQDSGVVGLEEAVDFSVQPTNFKVRGLLSLSQLPLLAQHTLPSVHVSQLYARPASDHTPPQTS